MSTRLPDGDTAEVTPVAAERTASASAPEWRLLMGRSRVRLLATYLQPRTALPEIRLDTEYAVLPVFLLTVRGHGPEKRDAMPRHGNVRVISARHQDGVAIPHDGNQFGHSVLL